jgi:hypothetical protein
MVLRGGPCAADAKAAPSPHQGKSEMNGIAFQPLAQFAKSWELVTVRYRTDSKEMRFVYANPIAAKALRARLADFPDGAMLGKIGRLTENDPAFTSSLVPSGAKRYQIMVRDRKKFASTAGWGYALFDQDGRTFGDEPKAASEACAACHALVKDRGYVFSTFTESGGRTAAAGARLEFEKTGVAGLPSAVKTWIRDADKELFKVVGPIALNVFPGTLDEVVPALTEKSLATAKPALLLSNDGKRFSLVVWDRLNKSCASDSTALLSVKGAPEYASGLNQKSFCSSK